jgi:hypothetical protein
VATLMIRMFAGRKHVLQLTAGKNPADRHSLRYIKTLRILYRGE